MTRQPFPKLLRPFVALLLAIATILVAAPSFAQEAKNAQEAKKRHIEKKFTARSYPGSGNRNYYVHLPINYNPAETLPLVMVLHGCLEQGGPDNPYPWAERIEPDSKFDDVADQERFIVVYPNHKWDLLSPTLPLCWEFWEEAHKNHRGQGDVADLAEIVKEVQKDYKVDPNRIHIAGLSSGACMTVAALVAYPDIFASGSPTAGVPYGETEVDFATHAYKPVDDIVTEMKAEMDGRMRPVPIFIIQSKDDETVNFHYAENIRDSWGKAFQVDVQNPISPPESGETKGTPWTHTKYGKGPDGNTVVETLFLKGLKHGWYGGGDGQFAFSNAPNTAQLAWEFFKAHPLPAQPSGGDTPR